MHPISEHFDPISRVNFLRNQHLSHEVPGSWVKWAFCLIHRFRLVWQPLVFMLSLVVLCLYGALFPLVVLWRLNHQYKARWKYEQRQQKRTNSVDPDSASTLPLLDEDLFVWSHEQTNCDPLAFMYVFVRPECYW